MVVDLSECDFIDSSVIGLLIGTSKKLQARDEQLVVVIPSESTNVARMAHMVRLSELMPVKASHEDALASLEGRIHPRRWIRPHEPTAGAAARAPREIEGWSPMDQVRALGPVAGHTIRIRDRRLRFGDPVEYAAECSCGWSGRPRSVQTPNGEHDAREPSTSTPSVRFVARASAALRVRMYRGRLAGDHFSRAGESPLHQTPARHAVARAKTMTDEQGRSMSLADLPVGPVIPVSDLERSRAFYEGTLGLKGEPVPGGHVLSCGGDTRIFLLTAPTTPRRAEWPLASFRADGLDVVVDELLAAGVVMDALRQRAVCHG